ncbi:1-acyl-sn-glycerol-3-phosphate acyltransferase [Romeria aff. gracilis LEGE 07310]|uniref:1-acyl-sn-glycerol-3-phosphate acyltransferase n=1 Tax=Vasconcelosia minhoensis LEGE 07310 TaxID=915328 RepID=A0A8J7AMR4_9CYAN|nr:lysophospholipid acyltransferase family protein [Romeria gracilis]MBE9077191.1 1-acyl-sn-glycerol-3-phosphate acyltransferase [Romeria aff. gracilis LEGE 07310]
MLTSLVDRWPIAQPPSPEVPSQVSPWLAPAMYVLGERGVLPTYFSRIEIQGAAHLPTRGPVLLAPTHRSRWDSLLIGYACRQTTGRYPHFMVTADECTGLQGWMIRQLGGFPVNTRQPSVKSLRYGIELLAQQQMLVIFPEGNIYRSGPNPLKPGFARLALQAQRSCPQRSLKIVPIHIQYDQPCPTWHSRVQVRIGPAIAVSTCSKSSPKQQAQQLTATLQTVLQSQADFPVP